ncbi:MAG: methionine adenosyltransferase, partial [Anaerolineae bacterium]
MRNILLESLDRVPVEEQQVELVERKGLGHPDSICDAIMEAISIALCREYRNTFGRILHHNIDKSLLVAGETLPKLGGGDVKKPMRLIFGDRAVYEFQG